MYTKSGLPIFVVQTRTVNGWTSVPEEYTNAVVAYDENRNSVLHAENDRGPRPQI